MSQIKLTPNKWILSLLSGFKTEGKIFVNMVLAISTHWSLWVLNNCPITSAIHTCKFSSYSNSSANYCYSSSSKSSSYLDFSVALN